MSAAQVLIETKDQNLLMRTKMTLFLVLLLIGTIETRKLDSEKPTRPPQKDECPHLEKNENNVQLYFMGEEVDLCCGAPPGYYIIGPCSKGNFTSTIIAPCEPGTYIAEKAHNRNSCDVDNVQCKPDMIKISLPNALPRCVCPMDHFRNKDNQCQRHTPCPPGQGVATLGNRKEDAGCQSCLAGESLISLTIDVCSPISNHSFNEYTDETPGFTVESTRADIAIDEETKGGCVPCLKASEAMPVWAVVVITVVIYTALILLERHFRLRKKIFSRLHSRARLTKTLYDASSQKYSSSCSFESDGRHTDSNTTLLDNSYGNGNNSVDPENRSRYANGTSYCTQSSNPPPLDTSRETSQLQGNVRDGNREYDSRSEGPSKSLLPVKNRSTINLENEQAQSKCAAETETERFDLVEQPSTSTEASNDTWQKTIKKVKEALLKTMDLDSLIKTFKRFSTRPPVKAQDILNELEKHHRNVEERMDILFDELIKDAGTNLSPSTIHKFYKETPGLNYLVQVVEPFLSPMTRGKEALLKVMSVESLEIMFKHFSTHTDQKVQDTLDELKTQYHVVEERMDKIFDKLIQDAGKDLNLSSIHKFFKETPELNDLEEVIEPFLPPSNIAISPSCLGQGSAL